MSIFVSTVTLSPLYSCSVASVVSFPWCAIAILSLILAGLTSVSHVKNWMLKNSGLLMLYSLESLRFYSVGCISSSLVAGLGLEASYFSTGVLGLPPWLTTLEVSNLRRSDLRTDVGVENCHKRVLFWPRCQLAKFRHFLARVWSVWVDWVSCN